jgi:hypothetical protein
MQNGLQNRRPHGSRAKLLRLRESPAPASMNLTASLQSKTL